MAKQLRERHSNLRNLDVVQMTTDTALMVSHEILEEGKILKDLEFVTDPDIPNGNDVYSFVECYLNPEAI